MTDFIFWPRIASHAVNNSTIDLDKANLFPRNYNGFFNSIIGGVITDFNVLTQHGWSLFELEKLGPIFKALSNYVKDSTINPNLVEGYIFAGFSMQKDLEYASSNEGVSQFIQ